MSQFGISWVNKQFMSCNYSKRKKLVFFKYHLSFIILWSVSITLYSRNGKNSNISIEMEDASEEILGDIRIFSPFISNIVNNIYRKYGSMCKVWKILGIQNFHKLLFNSIEHRKQMLSTPTYSGNGIYNMHNSQVVPKHHRTKRVSWRKQHLNVACENWKGWRLTNHSTSRLSFDHSLRCLDGWKLTFGGRMPLILTGQNEGTPRVELHWYVYMQ